MNQTISTIICDRNNKTQIVKSVKGLKSNSASPTDTWILYMVDGYRHHFRPIDKMFMKFWINGKSKVIYKNKSGNLDLIDIPAKIPRLGLDYEVLVYRDIIKPLLITNVCPNFVMFYGGNTNECYGDSLYKLLGAPTYTKYRNFISNILSSMLGISHGSVSGSPQENAENEQMIYNTLQSSYLSMYAEEYKRIIDDKNKLKESDKNSNIHQLILGHHKNSLKYSYLLSEALDKAKSFQDYIVDKINKDFGVNEWFSIYQIIFACYAMSKTRMVHNDFHLGNILILDLPFGRRQKLSYISDTEEFVFDNYNTKAKVFDFDRAYVARLGDNDILSNEMCEAYNNCNDYIPQKDATKFISLIIQGGASNLTDRNRINLLNIICKDGQCSALNKIEYRPNEAVISDGNRLRRMTSKDYNKHFRTIDEMVSIAGKLAGGRAYITGKDDDITTDNRYICKSDMFDSSGRLIVENLYM